MRRVPGRKSEAEERAPGCFLGLRRPCGGSSPPRIPSSFAACPPVRRHALPRPRARRGPGAAFRPRSCPGGVGHLQGIGDGSLIGAAKRLERLFLERLDVGDEVAVSGFKPCGIGHGGRLEMVGVHTRIARRKAARRERFRLETLYTGARAAAIMLDRQKRGSSPRKASVAPSTFGQH